MEPFGLCHCRIFCRMVVFSLCLVNALKFCCDGWISAKSSDAFRRPEQLLFSYPLLSTYPYGTGAALTSSVSCFVICWQYAGSTCTWTTLGLVLIYLAFVLELHLFGHKWTLCCATNIVKSWKHFTELGLGALTPATVNICPFCVTLINCSKKVFVL